MLLYTHTHTHTRIIAKKQCRYYRYDRSGRDVCEGDSIEDLRKAISDMSDTVRTPCFLVLFSKEKHEEFPALFATKIDENIRRPCQKDAYTRSGAQPLSFVSTCCACAQTEENYKHCTHFCFSRLPQKSYSCVCVCVCVCVCLCICVCLWVYMYALMCMYTYICAYLLQICVCVRA
jgi:hypothetical protein